MPACLQSNTLLPYVALEIKQEYKFTSNKINNIYF